MARIDLLKRVMDGMDATEEEARSFLQKLVPVVLLEDYEPSEVTPQPKWRQCVGGQYRAAVAAQYSMVHVRNWPGSGVLIVVDRIIAFDVTGGTLELYLDVVGYGSISAAKNFRDLRIPGVPVAQVRYTANAAHQGTKLIGYAAAPANYPIVLEGPWILDGGAAGQAIGIETNVVNHGLICLFEWRERDV